MSRLHAVLIAMIAALLGIAHPAAAIDAPSTAVSTYAYNNPTYDEPNSYSVAGPPVQHVLVRVRAGRLDGARESYDALVCHRAQPTDASYSNDRCAQLAQDASVGYSGDEGDEASHWRFSSFQLSAVAANSADDVARVLSTSEQRSLRSLQKQLESHTGKLDAYRANPDAFDNLGLLERAPTPEIRQRIIDGRIRHLETEIRTFQDQIDKLLGGG